MPFALAAWLPSLIMGGSSAIGSLFGSRAQGKAAETSAAASERSAEMQLEFGREQLQNLREIYNLDLSLQWPRHRLAGESLGQLARGMGSKLDPSVFETSEAPPELPSHSLGGGPGGGNAGAFGNISGGYELPEEGGPGKGMGFAGKDCWRLFSVAIGGYLAGRKDRARPAGKPITLSRTKRSLTRRIFQIESDVDRRIADGTMTDDDWAAASNAVRAMRDRYFEFTQPYERAGPGGRRTIGGWVDPLLTSWGNKAARQGENRGYGGVNVQPRAQGRPAQIEENPLGNPFGNLGHRAHGGPVRRTLSAMNQPKYWVGEQGPEEYVDNQGRKSMVGVGGPEIFMPPRRRLYRSESPTAGATGNDGPRHERSDGRRGNPS